MRKNEVEGRINTRIQYKACFHCNILLLKYIYFKFISEREMEMGREIETSMVTENH